MTSTQAGRDRSIVRQTAPTWRIATKCGSRANNAKRALRKSESGQRLGATALGRAGRNLVALLIASASNAEKNSRGRHTSTLGRARTNFVLASVRGIIDGEPIAPGKRHRRRRSEVGHKRRGPQHSSTSAGTTGASLTQSVPARLFVSETAGFAKTAAFSATREIGESTRRRERYPREAQSTITSGRSPFLTDLAT